MDWCLQVNTLKPDPAIANNQQSSYWSKSDADHHLQNVCLKCANPKTICTKNLKDKS